jgi:hypothetical protein
MGHQAVSKMTQIAFPESRENLTLGFSKHKKPYSSAPHLRRSENSGYFPYIVLSVSHRICRVYR